MDYVPGEASSDFVKYNHDQPVISLAKFKENESEGILSVWKKLHPIVIEPKYDGLTVVAYPKGNGSAMFVTRGSGIQGEILPNFINKFEGDIGFDSEYPVRGEVFLTHKAFSSIIKMQQETNEEPFKQIRNAAAGILRRKERSPYIDMLTFICYDVIGLDVGEDKKINYIKEHSPFMTTSNIPIDALPTIENIENLIETMKKMYQECSVAYPLDGIVIKTLKDETLKKYGSTGHHPNNSYAIKWQQQKFTTTVRDVIWQMGRSKATPVAIVDPVEIDGTTVTKASLHNMDYINEKGIKIGAKVTIYKANEIIPQIGEVLEPGDKEIILNVCPACGGQLTEINGQQFCSNPNCEERIAQNIAFLGSKDVLDIPGLSTETARKIVEMYDTGKDKQNIIFNMVVEDIEKLPGFAEKSAKKLYDAIQAARKDVELPRFIKALCIPGIGNNIGKILADEFEDLDTMHRMFSPDENESEKSIERLKTINGVGQVTAEALVSEEFWNAADDLSKVVSIAPYEKMKVNAMNNDYAGKTFVLTGKAPHPRSYYEELIKKAGGLVGSAVNSKTDFLVMADVNSTSTKAKKARELGVTLINPEQAEEMLS